MKKTIIVMLAILTLVSCNTGRNEASKSFPSKADTIRTIGVYVEIPFKTVNYGLMYVIVKDAVRVDSNLKAFRFKDTIPYFLPRRDTTGTFKQSFMEAVSFDFNVDSGFKKLSRWIKLNEKLLKTDSATFVKKK